MNKSQPRMTVVKDEPESIPSQTSETKEAAESPIKIQRRDKTFTEVEKKLKQMVLNYLRDASQDPLGKDYHYNRYENEWKVFCAIKNKQQRDVKLHFDGFKNNVEYFLELAAANNAETLKMSTTDVTEHRGDSPNPIQ